MNKKLILSFVFIMLISFASVEAIYYREKTESRTADGAYSYREIEFRGSVSGYAEDDSYRGRNYCSRRDYRKYYSDRYYGRGYSSRCDRRDYYRDRPVYTTYDKYNYNLERTNNYSYMGRSVTRTSRY